ncbi:MAG: glycosyltransferase family 4 protein [Gemmatimonadales bacterium]
MGPLRILVVNWLDRENPLAGGAETHLHEVFGRLAARGHDVTALVSGWPGCRPRANLDGIDVHRSGRRYTFSLTAPRYFRAHLAERPFDVVVEDLNKIPVFTPAWTRAPVVLLAHHLFGRSAFQAGPVPVALLTWLLEQTVPAVFRNRPTIAVSESTKRDLVRRGMRAERIRVVPNGVDLAFLTPAPEQRARTPTLVFLGRLRAYKRVDLVVSAVARLVAEGMDDVELLVAGEGDQRAALERQSRELGLGSRVRFLGYVDEEAKRDLFRRGWVHVLTSTKEGWGIANVEAAACGTPSVASDVPGLRESVVPGQTGLLVPHADVAALAGALAGLLGDARTRERLGRQARVFAERFSWDAAAEGVESVLREVVEGGRRG